MSEHLEDREKLILCACTAAVNVLTRRGLSSEDICNGLISYGGAMALEMVGAEAAAEIFQSKADGLVGAIQ